MQGHAHRPGSASYEVPGFMASAGTRQMPAWRREGGQTLQRLTSACASRGCGPGPIVVPAVLRYEANQVGERAMVAGLPRRFVHGSLQN